MALREGKERDEKSVREQRIVIGTVNSGVQTGCEAGTRHKSGGSSRG